MVGACVGQRCVMSTVLNLGTGPEAMECDPARRPNVGRVWSKHCEFSEELVRDGRVGQRAGSGRGR